MQEVTLDISSWPILVATFGVTRGPSRADMEAFTREVEGHYRRREPLSFIIVIRHQSDAKGRRVIADWTRSNVERIRLYNRGVAYVADSAITRGSLTALFWLAKPVYQYVVLSTVEEAREWCTKRLQAGAA